MGNLNEAISQIQQMRADTQSMMHQICPPSASVSAASTSISNPSNITNVTVAGNNYTAPIDHAIQGKMLKCESTITLQEWETHPAEWVKEKMLKLMLDEMMKEHCIEFTMTKDNHMDMVKVRARVFVTPDTQVRLLREKGSL